MTEIGELGEKGMKKGQIRHRHRNETENKIKDEWRIRYYNIAGLNEMVGN